MTDDPEPTLEDLFAYRFGTSPPVPAGAAGAGLLRRMAVRRSHRAYAEKPVEAALIGTLAAAALSAPSKSDLQQADILIIEDKGLRAEIDALFPGSPWMATAPVFLIFLANNRRQRQLHQWRGKLFANDHLDAFFNAAVDAAIVLSAFVIAADAVGLGCCPISAVRNHSAVIGDLLSLPDHVFPVAGLTLGWPKEEGAVSLRLPLEATVHRDRFDDSGIEDTVAAYDMRRAELQPYSSRITDANGTERPPTWSEAKAHQYSTPERADFGRFVRAKGFRLD